MTDKIIRYQPRAPGLGEVDLIEDVEGEYVDWDDYQRAVSKLETCRDALREAMGWNWMNDDMPVDIIKQCEDALK